MEKVKRLVNKHYEENMKERFYESDVAKGFDSNGNAIDVDWESAFFIWHRPSSNIEEFNNLPVELR